MMLRGIFFVSVMLMPDKNSHKHIKTCLCFLNVKKTTYYNIYQQKCPQGLLYQNLYDFFLFLYDMLIIICYFAIVKDLRKK